MEEVIALQSFDHGGKRRKGDKFTCSASVAKELARRNLARVVQSHVQQADGEKSSASPAAPASAEQTQNQLENGDLESPPETDQDSNTETQDQPEKKSLMQKLIG